MLERNNNSEEFFVRYRKEKPDGACGRGDLNVYIPSCIRRGTTSTDAAATGAAISAFLGRLIPTSSSWITLTKAPVAAGRIVRRLVAQKCLR